MGYYKEFARVDCYQRDAFRLKLKMLQDATIAIVSQSNSFNNAMRTSKPLKEDTGTILVYNKVLEDEIIKLETLSLAAYRAMKYLKELITTTISATDDEESYI